MTLVSGSVSKDIYLGISSHKGAKMASGSYSDGVERARGCHSSTIGIIDRNNNTNKMKNWIRKYAKWAANNQLETDLAERR